MVSGLTIISVYHNILSKRMLELNYEVTKKLNLDEQFVWLVGDNTPEDFPNPIQNGRFTVIRNMPAEAYQNLGSHHHASAINKCLPHVNTRFVVSLDSDFYIVRPNWIKDVTNYMIKNNLAFFGVPYYAKDWGKYRYFPSVVGMFIDLDKVDLKDIDYTPGYKMDSTGKIVRAWKEEDGSQSKKKVSAINIPLPLRHLKNYLGKIRRTFNMQKRRKSIGGVRDTGYGIYTRFGRTAASECVTAIVRPSQLRQEVPLGINKAFELFLPDRLCYLPKRKGAVSIIGFVERGYPDIAGLGWEEYIWKDKPFGTHIHGSLFKLKKRGRTEDEEYEYVRSMLKKFNIGV